MLEELYTQLREPLVRYCRTLDPESAEDLTQETYLRALTHWTDLQELERDQQRAWLYKTARNLFIDRARRQRRQRQEWQEEGLDLPFDADFTGPMVAQLMGRLPPEDRTIFALRHFSGYNAAEIGELLHMPSSTVRARLAAIRRRLREWYQAE